MRSDLSFQGRVENAKGGHGRRRDPACAGVELVVGGCEATKAFVREFGVGKVGGRTKGTQ